MRGGAQPTDPESDPESDPGPDPGLPLLPRLLPGDEMGEFVVDEFHAEGGWSDVYRAHHRSRDLGPLALKVMPLVARPPLASDRFPRIPHVVPVFATGTVADRGLAWIAMRFVEGRSLDRLSTGGPPAPRVQRLLVARCAEIAGALAALHRQGLVHGDVKPANILVEDRDGEGAAVLVDLGCTRAAGAAGPASTILATLPFAAPEQLLGLDVDGRADVFALGLCLHDLLAGRTPEARRRRPAAGMEPLGGLVPGFDPDLAAIVAEAVAPTRELRYRDAAALARDLRRWLDGRPPGVRPRGPWRRAVRCFQKQPARFFRCTTVLLLWLAAAVALAALAASFARHSALRRDAATALATGDLPAALRCDRELAAFWTALGLGSPVAALGAADPEVGAVLADLREGRSEQARQRAARLLGRDGVESHAPLVAWLLWQAGEPGRAGRRSAAVLSHALYDCPVQETGGAATRLRNGLLALLQTAGDDRALHALAALGGAAGLDDLEQVTGAWLDCVARHSAPVEALRLGLEVSHRICARAATSATAGVETGDRAAAAIGRVGAWLGRQPELPVWRASVEPALDGWLLTLWRLRRAAGRPPPDLRELSLPWPPTATESAIAGDASWLADLRGDDPVFADPYSLGFAVGLLHETPEALAFRPRQPEVGPDADRRWLQAFAAGRRDGSAASTGPDRWHAIEPGSGLCDGGREDGAFTPLPAERLEATSPTLARWSLLGRVPACGGTARSIAVRAVGSGTDEILADSHYLLLGAAGASAVRLEFTEPGRMHPSSQLVLSAQKGQRGALPFGGEAGLEIALDDRVVATIRDLGATAGEFTVRLGRMEVGRARRLEIRLDAESNTTVRLFEVWIE